MLAYLYGILLEGSYSQVPWRVPSEIEIGMQEVYVGVLLGSTMEGKWRKAG